MDWESWFGIGGQLAAAGWLVLIVAPRRWRLLNAVPRYAIPLALSLGYAVLILVWFGEADGGFGSLAAVKALMASDPVLLAGWVHYLAFDLFVGGWIARDADRRGLSRLVQAPILALTFMFGPIGLASYLCLAALWRRMRAAAARTAPLAGAPA
ncbi:MAG: ABA4-like family protein [Alphaproteobacteria bacterium]